MQKVLNKQNRQTKTDEEEDKEEKRQKRIPGSVIFHPYHFRQIDRSGIIERLKAKQLKYQK